MRMFQNVAFSESECGGGGGGGRGAIQANNLKSLLSLKMHLFIFQAIKLHQER